MALIRKEVLFQEEGTAHAKARGWRPRGDAERGWGSSQASSRPISCPVLPVGSNGISMRPSPGPWPEEGSHSLCVNRSFYPPLTAFVTFFLCISGTRAHVSSPLKDCKLWVCVFSQAAVTQGVQHSAGHVAAVQ